MNWIDIGHIDDVPLRGARQVKTKVGCLAVFRTAEDEVFAVTNACPHKGGPLSEGIVHGTSVTCPLHNTIFELSTGKSHGVDAYTIDTYPVRIDGDRILLNGDAIAQRSAA
ncbi:nitrite reductase small subunit NirD [Citreicella sp. C3M06]|uniref:nitrite reductase small subunit NirD n=1 Tax=Roseobacteraceae TaxID=2854170 RepID=UPI001C09EEB7|nr:MULTISPECIES: nitrite reductase small subunit NirD [Roseobacteraceae]MBU2960458.1 nitrite reductase small subunit NirD [Citreicella sp. C3M06]MDO6585555.1 nitrite reductase small subunit NirD [Salipiger sp. 1_MG-2023]